MLAQGARGAARRLGAVARGESLWLFLFVFAALGCFVHTRNQVTWNLQHAWVEALGERGVMHVDGSPTPRFALERLGDYWTAPDGHAYARNAPGTYLTAAGVYRVLRLFGLSYQGDFDLTSCLVTLFTTGLASALVFLLLYQLGRRVTASRSAGACVALAYSFGTLAFAYSGTLYQHQTAAFFFVAAFALAFLRHHDGRWAAAAPALEGLLLGLGVGYSFAYTPIGLCLAAYSLSSLRNRRVLSFLAGLALGAIPLVVINATFYGGPLTTVYQASGDAQVTTLDLTWPAVARRLHFYLTDPTTGVLFYSPVLAAAAIGLLRLPGHLRREQLALGAAVGLSFAHLLFASGVGALQFGPRLVIPTLPFLILGSVAFWGRAQTRPGARGARLVFLLLLVPSIAFSTLGALGSTMFRDVARWNAWYVYLHALFPPVPEGMPVYNLPSYVFPLRAVLRWVALGAFAMAAWRLHALRSEGPRPLSESA